MRTHDWRLPYDLEADYCRSQASAYAGQAEEKFLLRLADEFDVLAQRCMGAEATMQRSHGPVVCLPVSSRDAAGRSSP